MQQSTVLTAITDARPVPYFCCWLGWARVPPLQFFFEDHVDFAPMLPYWGSFIKKGSSLASSYKLFSALRQQGVRAHSWV